MPPPTYYDVKIVKTDAPNYLAWMRRMRDNRPSRGGPRAAGEVLGGRVETAVQHWLSKFVPLREERILGWTQRLRNGRNGDSYREMDGVWQIDDESLCLFEIKLTFQENRERGVGLKQLNTSSEILFTNPQWKYILKRLVYVAEEPHSVLADEESEGVPFVEPNDEYAELGVVWITPQQVEEAAKELEIELPENWQQDESREGHFEDPAREEWRQFAGADTPAAEANEDVIPDDNSLAQALRRAMGQE